MKRINLDLANLQVESFVTDAASRGLRGTIRAHDYSIDGTCRCTVGCPIDTENNTCNGNASCNTCGGNASQLCGVQSYQATQCDYYTCNNYSCNMTGVNCNCNYSETECTAGAQETCGTTTCPY